MPKPPHRIDQIQQLANLLGAQTQPVDTNAKIHDKTTLQILTDNIHCLEHPQGWIKHPYFNTLIARDSQAVTDMRTKFCEAIVLLLQKHDRLKCTPSKANQPKSPKPSSTPSSSASSAKPKSPTKSPEPKQQPPSK